MKIIAFGHRRRVGKNTCADMAAGIARASGLRTQTMGFADAVKEQAYQMFRWAGLEAGSFYDENQHLKDTPLESFPKLTPRDIWIHLGEKMREICPEMWAELLWDAVKPNIDLLLIYDLRKLPEVNSVLLRGGLLCKVNRPGTLASNDSVDSELADYDGWHLTVENCGSKVDLMNKMTRLIREVIRGA